MHKRGYLNALASKRGSSLGDTPPMLEARQAFLAAGHFEPIAAAIDAVLPRLESGAVVDAGCGTGYYLERVLRVRAGWSALAMDASAPAVALATRAAGCPGLVADTWQPLPIRDAAATVVLCVFAPRNPAEFQRILVPGGTLLTVTPLESHLRELRSTGELIGMQADKQQHLDDALTPYFEPVERQQFEYTLALSEADLALLTGMGPTAHHERGRARPTGSKPATITVGVSVGAWTPRESVEGALEKVGG